MTVGGGSIFYTANGISGNKVSTTDIDKMEDIGLLGDTSTFGLSVDMEDNLTSGIDWNQWDAWLVGAGV